MKSMKTEVTLTQVNVRIKISVSWPTNMQNEVNKTPFRKAYLCVRHEYAERWLTGHIILKPGFHSRWLYLPHLGTLHGGIYRWKHSCVSCKMIRYGSKNQTALMLCDSAYVRLLQSVQSKK